MLEARHLYIYSAGMQRIYAGNQYFYRALKSARYNGMNSETLNTAIENIYTSIGNDNEDIDFHIANLKAALQAAGQKEVEIQSERLVQNNRAGRKMMQSYFKKRGVKVVFAA